MTNILTSTKMHLCRGQRNEGKEREIRKAKLRI
jgi:hypothetical protein